MITSKMIMADDGNNWLILLMMKNENELHKFQMFLMTDDDGLIAVIVNVDHDDDNNQIQS